MFQPSKRDSRNAGIGQNNPRQWLVNTPHVTLIEHTRHQITDIITISRKKDRDVSYRAATRAKESFWRKRDFRFF
ncbi:hypothetical protein QCA50_008342 [Cerrena zonata]|uniref:Uncharacterized protein n=1 Tax=Cerrena zonata TaxID=2478898 RepID=A0AAW0GB58_9APHY